MEEILFELREHSSGLNAGRWDYIFSIIKKFREHPEFVLPDRSQVTMAAPFMKSYAEALVRACHRRGASAIGGMSAFIPSRRDPEVNEKAIPAIEADKRREGEQGFDGAWVAHPDLVPVVRRVFDEVLGDRPNQIGRLREDVEVSAADLLDVASVDAAITEEGLRSNVAIGLLYINSWLHGRGAAALFNQMEDTATAEISRSQVWQWLRHGSSISGGPVIDRTLVERVIEEETEKVRLLLAESGGSVSRLDDSRSLFEEVTMRAECVDFLTLAGESYLRD
jgi:malate synthase